MPYSAIGTLLKSIPKDLKPFINSVVYSHRFSKTPWLLSAGFATGMDNDRKRHAYNVFE